MSTGPDGDALLLESLIGGDIWEGRREVVTHRCGCYRVRHFSPAEDTEMEILLPCDRHEPKRTKLVVTRGAPHRPF